MPDSAVSNVVTGVSPAQPAPLPPSLGAPSFDGLKASLPVTLPTADVNGAALGDIVAIKVFCGPSGQDLASVAPVVFSGPYNPGATMALEIQVAAWSMSYDFEATIGI